MNPRATAESLTDYFRATSVALVCAYLFGSHARGEARPDSDIDIAVLLPADAPATVTGPLSTLRGDLERLLRRPVDLIDLRKAAPDLVHRVLRDGRLLVERDPGQRIAFEVRARNDYFDVLPYLLRYRRVEAA
jgi:predicted nucleotidyltransferase